MSQPNSDQNERIKPCFIVTAVIVTPIDGSRSLSEKMKIVLLLQMQIQRLELTSKTDELTLSRIYFIGTLLHKDLTVTRLKII